MELKGNYRVIALDILKEVPLCVKSDNNLYVSPAIFKLLALEKGEEFDLLLKSLDYEEIPVGRKPCLNDQGMIVYTGIEVDPNQEPNFTIRF